MIARGGFRHKLVSIWNEMEYNWLIHWCLGGIIRSHMYMKQSSCQKQELRETECTMVDNKKL